MRRRNVGGLALLAFLPAAALAGDLDLTPKNWRDWKKKIVPAQEELAWQKIAWRASFYAALEEGQKEEKPLLLWAMNGHPLGCT
jgi:hypothetical protein